MPFENIQKDPDICSNCFRRTHDRYERNYRLETYFDHEEGEWSVRPVNIQGITITVGGEETVIGGMDDDVYRNREETMKIPERGAIRRMRTVCKCGFRYLPYQDREPKENCHCDEEDCDCRKDWKNRPLNKSRFFEIAERIRDRLHENDVSFSEDAYFAKLEELKSEPSEQFADDDIFRKACQYASTIETIQDS